MIRKSQPSVQYREVPSFAADDKIFKLQLYFIIKLLIHLLMRALLAHFFSRSFAY